MSSLGFSQLSCKQIMVKLKLILSSSRTKIYNSLNVALIDCILLLRMLKLSQLFLAKVLNVFLS